MNASFTVRFVTPTHPTLVHLRPLSLDSQLVREPVQCAHRDTDTGAGVCHLTFAVTH